MAQAKLIAAMTVGLFTVTACTTPTNPNYTKTRNGAAIGAAIGAASQLIAGNSKKSVLKGAVVGTIAGGGVGYFLDRQEQSLRQDLDGSGATITNTGNSLIVTLPEAITFESDSTFVRGSSQSHLRQLANNLQQYPDSTVDIVGHTDSVGDENYNQNLSARRADSVAEILHDSGVAYSRTRAYGRGETEPVASNDSSTGRAQNRRVEVVIRPTA